MKQSIATLVIALFVTTSLFANPIATESILVNHINITNDEGKKLVVVPNLKTGNATINFSAEKAGKGLVVVEDQAGNIVSKQKVVLEPGMNKININNFTNLDEGSYTVSLNTGHHIYETSFLLWK